MIALLNVVVGLVVIAGGLFCFVASLGLIRLPDVYTRMHAASKAGTLGSGLLLISLGVIATEWDVLSRALAGFIFFLLTAPVSAHLIARAAHSVGYRPCPETVRDDLFEENKHQGAKSN
ncbi:monovalent cation/H(+) antiporter subunit G [Rhodobacteraceae bacterium RKSG542]|uniref:monovalent cation/H(+) antiporter subunit G n=1 Tax=Pseudovibrio flavus TaxID=2529854 RepID=UPI0012BCF8AC|nr:monovalent cation/H(+) antiporter subunit G [Pseudovibrio flavus]MTI18942.1 monovalent cation/H(+) antiporter subunit G [Pseudovibrio flavus]